MNAPSRTGAGAGGAGTDRIGVLRQAKLRALVKGAWAVGEGARSGPLPGGATLHDQAGERAWVLIDDAAAAGLGAALAWARRHRAAALDVIVEDGTAVPPPSGAMARTAGQFRAPPSVWRVEDDAVVPAPAAGFEPVANEGPPAEVVARFTAELRAHGVDPLTAHGTLCGEVLGLEVARLVHEDGVGWRLSVGVGRHDREARQELRPGEVAGAALEEVVGVVRRWRTDETARHPANTLARPRLLRAAVLAHPELAGAAHLHPVEAPTSIDDLRVPAPAGALGVDAAGSPVLAVCSTGVDVELVPAAADLRLRHSPQARLVLVVPEADAYPVTRELAASLRLPAEVRTVESGWVTLAG